MKNLQEKTMRIMHIAVQTLFLFVFIILLLQPVGAQTASICWPEITHETKPWTRWWWMGSAVTENGLTDALTSYRQAGLGGVEITPIYGVRGNETQFIEYLSPSWMDKLTYTLQEAKRLDMGVDMANASGWPFGGPWVDENEAAHNLVWKIYYLKGGESLVDTIHYIQKPLVRMQRRRACDINQVKYPLSSNLPRQEFDFDQLRYQKELPLICLVANKVSSQGFSCSIDLTEKVHNGILDWTAPEGKWILSALFQGDHGKMVERSGPGGEGLAIDHFSVQAINNYLRKFEEAFDGHDIDYLRNYFNDSYEVDDAIGQANWTPLFFSDFQRLQGYDLKKHLPALLKMDTPEMNSRVLYDYRMTISQLLLDSFTNVWGKWASKQGKGIRNQAHASPANILDLYAASDIPEIEGNDMACLKFASSASHITGKRFTSSETCTWLNEHFISTLGNVKNDVDKFLLAGVNHIFYHGTAYSPKEVAWPGWLFYAAVHFTPANSFWEDFNVLNQYVARAQSFLQAGTPSNDILVYFSIADLWSQLSNKGLLKHFHTDKFLNGLSMGVCCDYFLQKGYSWDAISDKQLSENISVQDGRLHTKDGAVYQTIVIPQSHLMPITTFRRLFCLAQNGATILFHGGLPTDIPGLSSLESGRQEMKMLKNKLKFIETDDVHIAFYGKGRIVCSNRLQSLLDQSTIVPEKLYKHGLQSIRRLKKDNDSTYYYFIKNPSSNTFVGWVPLNADYKSALLYNPMNGKSGAALLRSSKENNPEIYLRLLPGETLVVETSHMVSTEKVYPFFERNGTPIELSGKWSLTFMKGGPSLPAPLVLDTLSSWTKYGRDYENFSGTAEYRIHIPHLPKAKAWLLSFDEIHESASIYINDTYIGSILDTPYSIEINGEQIKENDKLTIRVSNQMANHIHYLDKEGIEWRKFYNVNFNAKIKENQRADGIFTTIKWKVLNSGICGKVKLIPLKSVVN